MYSMHCRPIYVLHTAMRDILDLGHFLIMLSMQWLIVMVQCLVRVLLT